MKQADKKAAADRRSFLKMMGVGAVTGGAALASGASDASADTKGAKDESLYRETPHVRTYYDLAKF